MTQDEILTVFKESKALLEGHFKLSSGNHSQFYLQSAKVLEDPKTAKTWRKVFDKEELVEVLHECNPQHFAQSATDGTSFTQDPLYSLLQFRSDTVFRTSFHNRKINLTIRPLEVNLVHCRHSWGV